MNFNGLKTNSFMKSNVISGKVDASSDKLVILLDLCLPDIIDIRFDDSELENIENILNLFATMKCSTQIITNNRETPNAINPIINPIFRFP